MPIRDMDFMIGLLYKRAGLALSRDKEYLLESRLGPVARARGCRDLDELVGRLKADPPESLLSEVTEAMLTHESSFFRDGKPFDCLRTVMLPKLRENAATRRSLRIWSAACATGQEPYSIAMLLLEEAGRHPGWQYEILASDLSAGAVEKAGKGVYSQFEAQRGMPIQLLLKYFRQNPDTSWQVSDELRGMVRFRTHNLLDESPPEPFDVIFCRNVLMYFDAAAKSRAVERLCGALSPGGFLVLGSTESLLEHEDRLCRPEDACPGVYALRKRSAPMTVKTDTKLRSMLS